MLGTQLTNPPFEVPGYLQTTNRKHKPIKGDCMKDVIETTCIRLSDSTEVSTSVKPKEKSMKDSIYSFFNETFTEENLNKAIEHTIVAVAVSTQAVVDSGEYVAEQGKEIGDKAQGAYKQASEYISTLDTDEFKTKMDEFTTSSK